MRIRFLAAALFAVFVAGSLSACQGQGESAVRWLESQEIVESVAVDGGVSGFEAQSTVTAVIEESATSDEIHQLFLDSVAYDVENDGRGTVTIALSYRDLSLFVSSREGEGSLAFEKWNVLRLDPRVDGGLVSAISTDVSADRADLVDLAVEYGSLADDLRVTQYGEKSGPSFSVAGCGLDGDGAVFAQSLVDDDAVRAAVISLCSEVTLATASPEEMAALATRVHQLAEESDRQELDISVGYDVDDENLVDSPRSTIPLGLFDDRMQGLLTRVSALPSTLSVLSLDSERALIIGITHQTPLRETVTSVLGDPDLAAVSSVSFSSDVEGRGVVLEASALDHAALSLDLIEQLVQVDDVVSVAVTPTRMSVNMADDDLATANGRAAIDLIAASGLWNGHDVSIGNGLSGHEAFSVNEGIPQAGESDLVNGLVEYWLATVPVR